MTLIQSKNVLLEFSTEHQRDQQKDKKKIYLSITQTFKKNVPTIFHIKYW